MWLFYALAGPIALGMVTGVLQYFAARTVTLYVRLIVGYTWFCTISIIVLVPADIWIVSDLSFSFLRFSLSSRYSSVRLCSIRVAQRILLVLWVCSC